MTVTHQVFDELALVVADVQDLIWKASIRTNQLGFRVKGNLTLTEEAEFKITGGNAIFEIGETLQTQNDFSGDGSLQLQAKTVRVEKKLRKQQVHFDNIMLQVGELILHRNTHFKADKSLVMKGDAVRAAGTLIYGDAVFYLNHYFLDGLSELSDLSALLDKSSETAFSLGDSIRIVTGAYIKMFSMMSVRTFSLSCVLEFIFLASTEAHNDYRSCIIPIDLGINLPNLSVILDDLESFFTKIVAFDFAGALHILTSSQSIKNACTGMLLTLGKQSVPALSSTLDFLNSLRILANNLPQLWKQIQALRERSQRGETLQLYDAYGLIEAAMSVGLSCEFAVNQGLLIWDQGWRTLELHGLEWGAVATATATFFAPTQYEQGVFGFDMGVHLAGFRQNRTLLSYNTGLFSAELIGSHTSFYTNNFFGIEAAGNLTFSGNYMLEGNKTYAISLVTDVGTLDQTGTVVARSRITNDGRWNPRPGSRTTVRNMIIDAMRLAAAEVDALVRGTGIYQTVDVTDTLTATTNVPLNLGGILRDCQLQLTATDIAVIQALALKHPLLLKATKGNVLINAPVTGSDITLLSDEGHVDTPSAVTATGSIIIDAKTGYNNVGSLISGNTVFIHVSNGDITIIQGGKVFATTYLQAVTDGKGNIILTCKEETVQGAYGPMKKYTAAECQGGTGKGYGNVGMLLSAGGKIIDTGSSFTGVGSIVLQANGDILFIERTNQYCSYYYKWKGWTHSKEVIGTNTQLQAPVVESDQGRIIVRSREGAIHAVSTDFLSAGGAELTAQGKVTLAAAVLQSTWDEDRSYFGGLFGDSTQDDAQSSAPTVVVAPAQDVSVNSETADVDFMGARIVAGALTLSAPNGNVSVDTLTLTENLTMKKSGFSVGLPSVGAMPLVDDAKKLSNKNNSVGTACTAVTAAVDTVKLASNGVAVAQGGGASLLASALGVNTDVSVTFTKSEVKITNETLADAGIDVDTLTVTAGKKITVSHAVPIHVKENATFTALEEVTLQGATVKSTTEEKSASQWYSSKRQY